MAAPRRNLIRNPRSISPAAPEITNGASGPNLNSGSTLTEFSDASGGVPASVAYYTRVVTTAASSAQGVNFMLNNQTYSNGVPYRGRIYVYCPGGLADAQALEFVTGGTHTDSSTYNPGGPDDTAMAAGWTLIEPTAWTPSADRTASDNYGLSVRTNTTRAMTFYVQVPIVEQTSGSVGTYFPTGDDLGSGAAGWLGTPNASASEFWGAAYSYHDRVILAGPSLYWTLDATTGATDLSGNGYTGTGLGGVSIGGYTGSPLGVGTTATDFDADAITSTYQPFVAATWRTFTGWAWRDASATYDELWGGNLAFPNNPILWVVTGSTDVQFWPTANGSATWTAAWPGTGQWVYWALTYNPSSPAAELFINGVSVGTQTPSVTPWGVGTNEFVLADAGLGFPWNGKQAHVAIWERALSAAEIRAHYNAGTAAPNTIQIPTAARMR